MEFHPAIAPEGMIPGGQMVIEDPNVTGYHGNVHEEYQQDPNMFSNEEFAEVKHVFIDGGNHFTPSTVAFDGQEELLWMGNHGGHITSYYGTELQKYTSFQVHESSEIRQMLTMENLVLSLTRDRLCCSTKFGRSKFNYKANILRDMQCMIQTGPTSLLMGGHQNLIVEYDVGTNKSLRQVDIGDAGCAIFRYPNEKFVYTGDTSGKITLRDPTTLKSEHVLQAHSGTLSDFDVHGNQLITCGFSNRMGALTVDRLLMVYDLRVMRAMTPMQVNIEPMFLRFVPTYSSRICVVSQSGQFQVLEQGSMTPSSMVMYQVQTEGAGLTSFDLSSSYQALAFGDAGGYLHLFTGTEQHAVFNTYSTETEIPHTEHPPHSISIDDELTPYSIIPMVYPSGNVKLASDWPEDLCKRVYRKPAKIDPNILLTMKMVQKVGYAPNPGTRKRNQIPYVKEAPRKHHKHRERKSSVPESPSGRGEDPFLLVPKRYRKVEIKYSKLGVEDFDFRHYNKTNFAGLETHIPNAYCNAMLQVLYFIEPLRKALLSHLCQREFCLTCELGFLFHMLDAQKGRTCQGSNFLRAFRTIPEASALGLILADAEESMGKANLPRLIQNWTRFIMQQLHTELVEKYRRPPIIHPKDEVEWPSLVAESNLDPTLPSEVRRQQAEQIESEEQARREKEEAEAAAAAAEVEEEEEEEEETKKNEEKPESKDSIIKQVFGCQLDNTFTCRCGEVQSRSMVSSIVDLLYPDISGLASTPKKEGPQQYTFSEVVQRSISMEQNTQAWCKRCEKYQPHIQSKIVHSLPEVLALNCHLENARDYEFWKYQEDLLNKKEGEEDPKLTPINIQQRNVKLCRYGNACTRKDCRFRHETEQDRLSSLPQDPNNKIGDTVFPEKSWIPYGMKLTLTEKGKVEVENTVEDHVEKADSGSIHYELYATVGHIRDSRTGGNLISLIKVSEPYHQRKERVTCNQWYLFNDFSITPVENQEVIYFNMEWKLPCVVFFIRKDILQTHQVEIMSPITKEHLLGTESLIRTPRRKQATFIPLGEDELPTTDTEVGIDAEFVTLNQEEAELRSDGTRSTLKPSQLSVARVTCVRGGSGPLQGEPFIDDYISTQEQVVDYLTQFSGIQPGDLDATISSKHLTYLKSTYVKLRYLVDAGVRLVGHGLKKDFRVLNLVVPKDQIIDTVELFYLPRQRMISLKFLAWHFLGEKIQSGNHDSIEDARTALKLYAKYKDMQKDGMDVVRQKLKEMYERGRQLEWKIPDDDPSVKEETLEDLLAEVEFNDNAAE